jgi:hypothetical protein
MLATDAVANAIAREIWRYNECPWDFDAPPDGMAQLQKQFATDQANGIVAVLGKRAAEMEDMREAMAYFLQHKELWDEFADSFARDRTHDWFHYDAVKGDCCRRCGIVRRADRMNNPCRGAVKVGPRKDEA